MIQGAFFESFSLSYSSEGPSGAFIKISKSAVTVMQEDFRLEYSN